jgi:8-oxo-dGTP pyrophosphatase MutT (NUDIX family)
MIETWPRGEPEERFSCRVFAVDEISYTNPYTGDTFQANVIRSKDWTNVIATTPEGDILLIRQFRFGSNRIEVEIPGGLIEDGEPPAAGAARELKEETGFEGDGPVLIGTVNPNPAIHKHACYTFLIQNCVQTGPPEFDGPNEKCEVFTAPPSEVLGLVTQGTITHSLVITAIFWFCLHSGNLFA